MPAQSRSTPHSVQLPSNNDGMEAHTERSTRDMGGSPGQLCLAASARADHQSEGRRSRDGRPGHSAPFPTHLLSNVYSLLVSSLVLQDALRWCGNLGRNPDNSALQRDHDGPFGVREEKAALFVPKQGVRSSGPRLEASISCQNTTSCERQRT